MESAPRSTVSVSRKVINVIQKSVSARTVKMMTDQRLRTGDWISCSSLRKTTRGEDVIVARTSAEKATVSVSTTD